MKHLFMNDTASPRCSSALMMPRWLLLAGLAVAPFAHPPSANAQDLRQNLSPGAPGELTKPEFDTASPVYEKSDTVEKSAQAVVAEVDGRPITLGAVGDIIRALPPSARALPFDTLFPVVVDRLIQQQALVIRAQHQGLDEEPTIRRRMKAAADHVLTDELLHREIGSSITEKVLLERYDRDIRDKPGPNEAHARVILVSTESEAAAIISELQKGADFAAIARKSSRDATAPAGGDLGFLRRDILNAEIGAVVFTLAAGQLAPYPVKSASGWFVVKVEERRYGARPSFAAARDQLTSELLREGVKGVATAALQGITVRTFQVGGQEDVPDALKPD